MNQATLIERVVAEVMSKLMTSTTTHAEKSPEASAYGYQSFALLDRVITADLLAAKAKGQRVVEVGTKAIVTPAAKDWLRHQNVELKRSARPEASAGGLVLGPKRLAIVQAGGVAVERALEEARRAGVSNWRRELAGQAEDAAKLAISAICRGEAVGVVVFSKQPDKVACLANRNEQIRAAAVFSIADVERVQAALSCNVFVVEVGSKTGFELTRVLKKTETPVV